MKPSFIIRMGAAHNNWTEAGFGITVPLPDNRTKEGRKGLSSIAQYICEHVGIVSKAEREATKKRKPRSWGKPKREKVAA